MVSNRQAPRCCNLLLSGALVHLHIYVCRAYSPVRKGDRHMRASIEFLSEPGTTDEPTLQGTKLDYEKAIDLFRTAESDPKLIRLKHMRDKLIAHLGRANRSIGLPTYDDLFDFTRTTCAIWERLSFGAGTCVIELDAQVEAYRESAEAFWSKWERGSRGFKNCPQSSLYTCGAAHFASYCFRDCATLSCCVRQVR